MLPKIDLELTLEQQFQMQLIEKEVAAASQEKLKELVLRTTHMLMLKENIVRSLTRRVTSE